MTFFRPADSNLSTRLLQALTPEQESLLRLVAGEASHKRLPLYIVGGFVRDLLLGYPATDFDLVVEGDAISFARSLAGKYGGKVTGHSRFVTATWKLEHTMLDLISARSETYKHPAALPTVRLGTISDDLRRRDFTINTLAIRLDSGHFGELIDKLNGLDDLERGLVRVLHPDSFRDDPTRLYRAVRYEQRYGFAIVPETLALIPAARPLITKLSAERLRHELDLVLEEENSASTVKRLAELGLLADAHPSLIWNKDIQKHIEKAQETSPVLRCSSGWMLWLMDLRKEDIMQIESRLHFHGNLRDEILAASALNAELSSLIGKKPSQIVAILDGYPLTAVQAIYLVVPRGELHRNLQGYLETWRHVKPKTTGHALKKLGLEPGPNFQKILRLLRDAWLDGEATSEDEEISLLETLV